jgi:deoxyribodipyrimidine photolyase-like uncharacterized protein
MHAPVWILGDQLLEQHPALILALSEVGLDWLRVLLVESPSRVTRLPYQRKKRVLLFSAMPIMPPSCRNKGMMWRSSVPRTCAAMCEYNS